jgi:Pvc16 N-terminal domain
MTDDLPVSTASARVVTSVSHVLRDIIVRAIGDELGLTPADFSLTAPGSDPPARATGVSLFVYDLRPKHPKAGALLNSPALDGAWPVTPPGQRAEAPLQLELCYMVLPHGEDVRSEQKLAVALAKLFHAFATIHVPGLPESEARKELMTSGNVRMQLVAQYPDMDVIRRLWSRPEGGALKSALYYRVLPVFLPAQTNESLRRVCEIVAESRANV